MHKPNVNLTIFAAIRQTHTPEKPWIVFRPSARRSKQILAGHKAGGTRMAQALLKRLS